MANAKFINNLLVTRTYNKKGEPIVAGAVELRLNKPYGKNAVTELRSVTVGENNRSVANFEGGIKVNDALKSRIKYFFDKELPADTEYLNVRVSLWGKPAEGISKFNLSEGDVFLFIASSVKLTEFTRKNGSSGYQLEVSAFDFKALRTANKGSDNAAPAASAAAPAPAAPVENDFACIEDDDEDLPF